MPFCDSKNSGVAVDVSRADALDQLVRGQDLLDAFLTQLVAAQPNQPAKRPVRGNDDPIRSKHRQRHRQGGNHFLVIPSLRLNQREKARNFTGFPLLKAGALHLLPILETRGRSNKVLQSNSV